MRALEVMNPRVQTVRSSMPLGEAWVVMRERGVRQLFVTRGRRVVGVLSELDAGGRWANAARAGHTVADLMTGFETTARPTDSLRAIAIRMHGRTIGCVPVVDRGRLVGVVTFSGVLDQLARNGSAGKTPPTRPQPGASIRRNQSRREA